MVVYQSKHDKNESLFIEDLINSIASTENGDKSVRRYENILMQFRN